MVTMKYFTSRTPSIRIIVYLCFLKHVKHQTKDQSEEKTNSKALYQFIRAPG